MKPMEGFRHAHSGRGAEGIGQRVHVLLLDVICKTPAGFTLIQTASLRVYVSNNLNNNCSSCCKPSRARSTFHKMLTW